MAELATRGRDLNGSLEMNGSLEI